MELQPQRRQKIEYPDTLRGLAALCVVVAHYLGAFWYGRDIVGEMLRSPPLPAEISTPLYVQWVQISPIFNWGAYGVGVFFLISGFVIPLSLEKATTVGFLVNRVLRIYPVYIVGFSCTLLGIWVASRYFGSDEWYTPSEIAIHYVPGLRDLVWSKSIDGIVWTLEIELKFYLLCAIFLPFFKRRSLLALAIPVALFAVSASLLPSIAYWGEFYAPSFLAVVP